MVILNIDISVNKHSIINSIKNFIEKAIENYIENESLTEDKKKLIKSIVKTKTEEASTEYFWYRNSSENVCTHVYKRGKNEGYMCQKKINTNLQGQEKDYLCCKHSKKHIPIKKNTEKNDIKDIGYIAYSDISNNKIDINKKSKKIMKKAINRKKKGKKYICNFGILDFNIILKSLMW